MLSALLTSTVFFLAGPTLAATRTTVGRTTRRDGRKLAPSGGSVLPRDRAICHRHNRSRRSAEAFCRTNPYPSKMFDECVIADMPAARTSQASVRCNDACVAARMDAIKSEADTRNWASRQNRSDAEYRAREARRKFFGND